MATLLEPRSDTYQKLAIIDGMRVLCLVWILILGVCQFTMSASAANPWALQTYFHTYAFTAVYSSNLGFDELFFFASLFATLKLAQKPSLGLYLKTILGRYLRLAPLYYAVFLFGWQIGPHLSDGPCWFTYEKGFSNCDSYWWSVFTMTSNFVPEYVIANEGCYYWGWYPPCDLQILILLPALVWAIIAVDDKRIQAALITTGVLIGTAINFWVIWSNDFSAGLFAPQDIMIFDYFIIKPYTKLSSVFLGIALALVYTRLDEI